MGNFLNTQHQTSSTDSFENIVVIDNYQNKAKQKLGQLRKKRKDREQEKRLRTQQKLETLKHTY